MVLVSCGQTKEDVSRKAREMMFEKLCSGHSHLFIEQFHIMKQSECVYEGTFQTVDEEKRDTVQYTIVVNTDGDEIMVKWKQKSLFDQLGLPTK